jgi:hypothetical protein
MRNMHSIIEGAYAFLCQNTTLVSEIYFIFAVTCVILSDQTMNTNVQNDHCVRYYFNGVCLSSLPQMKMCTYLS